MDCHFLLNQSSCMFRIVALRWARIVQKRKGDSMSSNARIRQKLRALMTNALAGTPRSHGLVAVKEKLSTAIASEQFTVTSCRVVGTGQYRVGVTSSDGNKLALSIP